MECVYDDYPGVEAQQGIIVVHGCPVQDEKSPVRPAPIIPDDSNQIAHAQAPQGGVQSDQNVPLNIDLNVLHATSRPSKFTGRRIPQHLQDEFNEQLDIHEAITELEIEASEQIESKRLEKEQVQIKAVEKQPTKIPQFRRKPLGPEAANKPFTIVPIIKKRKPKKKEVKRRQKRKSIPDVEFISMTKGDQKPVVSTPKLVGRRSKRVKSLQPSDVIFSPPRSLGAE